MAAKKGRRGITRSDNTELARNIKQRLEARGWAPTWSQARKIADKVKADAGDIDRHVASMGG